MSDNWPGDIKRIVGAEVDLFGNGVALAEAGAFLALLPRPIASSPAKQRLLKPLDYAPAPSLALFAAHRKPVGEHPLTNYLLTVLRQTATQPARGYIPSMQDQSPN